MTSDALQHPLDGAFARIRRAGEHIDELKRILDKLRANPNAVFEFNAEATHVIATTKPLSVPFDDISIRIGEACYNLRAALDYLGYLLTLFSGGSVNKAKFPLETSPKKFAKFMKVLRLSPRHVAMLEAYQPYSGNNWLKALADMSNTDKHNRLTITGADSVVTARIGCGPLSNLPQMAGSPVTSATRPDGVEMHMQVEFAIDIALDDGTPVIQTLEIIQSQVAQTLDAFKTEFKRNDV